MNFTNNNNMNVQISDAGRARAPGLHEAIAFACEHETEWSRDVGGAWGIHAVDTPPFNRLRGPVHGRGPVSGVLWQHGVELASWGEPERADLTFSVAKTCLALLAGIAHDRGLLRDVHRPVVDRLPGIGFDSLHNRGITWAHLLQQTSEWEGECFGVPEQVDRYRMLSNLPGPSLGRKGDPRPLQQPGTYWEYNDVRINQLSLALLHLFGQALPEVFDAAVMQPVGATSDWKWVGYDDSWIELNGARVQSVPGGSHWGGGLSISARDQARIAQRLLEGGGGLVSPGWLERMMTPAKIAPYYGYLVWLNGTQQLYPDASPLSWYMVGAGASIVGIDPEADSVVVVRWIDSAHTNGFLARVRAALA